jgi:anti-sigma regulatory factor (Ser/Thr protein kinase)
MGLPNIKKNTDTFQLESEVGKGTTLTFENYLNKDNS